MKNKGISNIVATFVLVLLSTVAIIIVWQYFSLIISPDTLLAPKLNCLELQRSSAVNIKSSCYDGKDIKIMVERSFSDVKLNKLDFIINSEGGEQTWSCGNECGSCKLLNAGESKMYLFGPYDSIVDGKVIAHIGECKLDVSEIVNC